MLLLFQNCYRFQLWYTHDVRIRLEFAIFVRLKNIYILLRLYGCVSSTYMVSTVLVSDSHKNSQWIEENPSVLVVKFSTGYRIYLSVCIW